MAIQPMKKGRGETPASSSPKAKKKPPKEKAEIREVWKMRGAPPGGSSVGIFHGGWNEKGFDKSVTLALVDGFYTIDPGMSPEEADQLRLSMMQAGLERVVEPMTIVESVERDYEEEEEPEVPEPPENAEEEGKPLIGINDIGKAIWTLRHPDEDGGGPDTRGVVMTIDGKEYTVDLVRGFVTTKIRAVKDYLIGRGYELYHVEPRG